MTSRPSRSLFGWPRPATPVHGHELVTVELPELGAVQLARWLDPEARRAPATLDPARITAMRAELRPGDAAVVIGAAAGTEAVELGLAVGPDGAVVALESDRALFPVLAANAAHNRDRTRIFPHLLAVATGEPEPDFGVASHALQPFLAARHAAQLERLRWVSFRFDARGPELLEALRPLVAARHPRLRVQVGRSARRPQRHALLAFLEEFGYRVVRFAAQAPAPAEPVTPANVMRWKQLDLLARPDGGHAS